MNYSPIDTRRVYNPSQHNVQRHISKLSCDRYTLFISCQNKPLSPMLTPGIVVVVIILSPADTSTVRVWSIISYMLLPSALSGPS